MIDDLTTVSTDDLIAGNHISDVELFKCFSFSPEGLGNEDLYSFRRVAKFKSSEKKTLKDLMGNGGLLTIKKAATADEPAEITMTKCGVGGDADFRAARVAQLESLYQAADIDPRMMCDDNEPVEIPAIQDFYEDYKNVQ
jgi:hypothetical protein